MQRQRAVFRDHRELGPQLCQEGSGHALSPRGLGRHCPLLSPDTLWRGVLALGDQAGNQLADLVISKTRDPRPYELVYLAIPPGPP